MTKYGLQIGKQYTRKELFELVLGEEPRKGDSLKRQIKIIDSKLKYEVKKVGRNNIYTPIEFYKSEQIELSGKYEKLISPMILSKLNDSPTKSITLPTNLLMKEFGMINDNYIKHSKYITSTSEKIDVKPYNLLQFNNVVDTNIKKILKRSLESLRDKNIIRYDMVTMIAFTIKGRNKSDKCYILANNEMLGIIQETTYRALEHFDIVKESDVYKSGKSHQFYKLINDAIKQKIESILLNQIDLELDEEIIFNYYYSAYRISSTDYIIKKQLSKEEYKVSMNALNGLVVNYLNNNIEKTADSESRRSNLRELKWKYENNIGFDNSYIKDYIKDAKWMVELFIQLDTIEVE